MAKNNAIIKIYKVPYYNSVKGFQLLRTLSRYNERSFEDNYNHLIPIKIEHVSYGKFRKYLPFKKILSTIFCNIYDEMNFEFRVKK